MGDGVASLLSDGQVSSVTGEELIYLGLDPVSGLPRFDTLSTLLTEVENGLVALPPEYTECYLTALEQAAENFSFVQEPSDQSGDL
jgi:hypothetical protein